MKKWMIAVGHQSTSLLEIEFLPRVPFLKKIENTCFGYGSDTVYLFGQIDPERYYVILKVQASVPIHAFPLKLFVIEI